MEHQNRLQVPHPNIALFALQDGKDLRPCYREKQLMCCKLQRLVLLSFSSQAAKNHSTVQKTFGFVKLAQ
jgi:hypothetical protein